MTINKALSFVAMSAFLSLMSACAGNSNAISSNSNNPGAGSLGAGVDAKSCQIGQIHSVDYGCLSRTGCSTNSGFAVQANRCVTGQVVTEEMKFGRLASTRHFGRLTITNSAHTELMLQQAGLCNGVSTTMNMSGTSNTRCATWLTRGAFVIVKSFSGSAHNVNMMIGAGTQIPYDQISVLPGVYGSQIGGLSYGSSNYVSFSQLAHNYPSNNNNGMQIVGISPGGDPIALMLMVNNGNLGIDHMDAQLVYQGVAIATLSLDKF